jgi:starvation-inducible DNA-binding protein
MAVRMPRKFTTAASLDDARRAEIIETLNQNVARMIDLTYAAKEAHWNLRGGNFIALHDLFDTVANEARGYTDDLAERAVVLGGFARGTLADAFNASDLKAFPNDTSEWRTLAGEVSERMMDVAKALEKAASGLDDDLATQDLLIGIFREIEKRAWMVEAHLDDR